MYHGLPVQSQGLISIWIPITWDPLIMTFYGISSAVLDRNEHGRFIGEIYHCKITPVWVVVNDVSNHILYATLVVKALTCKWMLIYLNPINTSKLSFQMQLERARSPAMEYTSTKYLTHGGLVTPYSDVSVDKPLPETMLTNHSEDLWHSPMGYFTGNALDIYSSYEFETC